MLTIKEIIDRAAKFNPCRDQFSKLIQLYNDGNEADAWATIWGNIDWCIRRKLLTKKDFIENCTVAKHWWFRNEQLCTYTEYKNGKKHGVYKHWYGDGLLDIEANYENGKLHGVCKDYYRSGMLYLETNYVRGERHGTCREFDGNGNLTAELNYKKGKQHGVGKYWSENSKSWVKYYYENGVRIV